MKRKSIIAAVMAAVVALSAITVFALGTGDTTEITARFNVVNLEEADNEFQMTSEDETLTIKITDETVVYFEDYVPMSDECEEMTRDAREVLFGRTLAEVLTGRNLRVTFEESDYNEAIKVVILFEVAVHLPGIVSLEDFDLGDDNYVEIMPLPEVIDWDYEARRSIEGLTLIGEIVVNNEMMENHLPPLIKDGAIMVPLRVVAEALGYDVTWNEYLQSVQLGVAIHLWIDSTEVHLGRMAPIELHTAPTLIDSVTFVPLEFFRNVLGQYAYVFEGQVVVETYSDMR